MVEKTLMFSCIDCGDEYVESELKTKEFLIEGNEDNDLFFNIICPSCESSNFQMYYHYPKGGD